MIDIQWSMGRSIGQPRRDYLGLKGQFKVRMNYGVLAAFIAFLLAHLHRYAVITQEFCSSVHEC